LPPWPDTAAEAEQQVQAGGYRHRPINWTWQLGELFRIAKGKIRRIEAIFIRGPYGVCSGWSTNEQCRSEEPGRKVRTGERTWERHPRRTPTTMEPSCGSRQAS
jgi:hypothetical protein